MFYPEEPEAPTPIKPTRRNNFKRARSPTELESKWERKSKEYIVLRRDEVAELTAMEKVRGRRGGGALGYLRLRLWDVLHCYVVSNVHRIFSVPSRFSTAPAFREEEFAEAVQLALQRSADERSRADAC